MKCSAVLMIWQKRKKNGTGTEYPAAITVLPPGLPLKSYQAWGACFKKTYWNQVKSKQRLISFKDCREPNYLHFWKVPLRMHHKKLRRFLTARSLLKRKSVLPLCGQLIWIILILGSLCNQAPFFLHFTSQKSLIFPL